MNDDYQPDSPLIRALTKQSQSFITSFSIFGLPPSFVQSTESPQSATKLLYQYPPSFEYPRKAEQFIVPHPPAVRQLENKEVFNLEQTPFITLLPSETNSTICVCVRQTEFLSIPSDLIQPTNLTTELFTTNKLYITQRTYVFTTNIPYFTALVPILSYISECNYRHKIEYYKSVIVKVTDPSPSLCLTPITSILEAFIQQVFRIIPPSDTKDTISVTLENHKLHFPRSPLHLPPMPLSVSLTLAADYSLIRLFMTMSVDDILNVLSVMLSGMGVILISDNVTTATSCTFGFLSLFYPFVWPGIFLPYIPTELYEFYESPVPILCAGGYPPYQCRVNAYVHELDQSYFNFFTSKLSRSFISVQPSTFVLPWRTEISKQLTAIVNKYIPKKPSEADRETMIELMNAEAITHFSEDVMMVMDKYLYRPLELMVINFCIEMPKCSLEEFIRQFPKKFNPAGASFMKKFTESQHFNVWWYQTGLDTLKVKK